MATFTYFGEELRWAEEYPYFLEAEFHEARTREDLNVADGLGYALRFAQACVHPADRTKFNRLSRANNAKLEDWIRLSNEFTADTAERPTGQPTDSSDGPTSIAETSESEPVASVTPIASERPVRADLALAAARSRTA